MVIMVMVVAGLMVGAASAPLEVVEKESSLHAFEDNRGKAHAASCWMVVTVTNRTAEPLRYEPKPLTVWRGRRRIGRCEYNNTLVWKTAGKRSRFTAFEPPLAPGEAVEVKLIYRFVGLASDIVEAEASYRYSARFAVAPDAVIALEGAPFRPEVFPRDGFL